MSNHFYCSQFDIEKHYWFISNEDFSEIKKENADWLIVRSQKSGWLTVMLKDVPLKMVVVVLDVDSLSSFG